MTNQNRNKLISVFLGKPGYKNYAEYVDALTNFGDYQNYCEYENKAWYSGDEAVIRAFYQKVYEAGNGFFPGINYFWRKVCGEVSMVHIPLASSISEIMSNVLFGRMPEIHADTPNKTNNAKIDKDLNALFDYNNIEQSLQTASQLESYSGTVAAKIVLDEDFSAPIIQWYPAERLEVNERYGRVVEVVFRDTLYGEDKAHTPYILKTIAGRGYIRYELWKKGKDLCPLSSIKATEKLHDLAFNDEDGQPIDVLMTVFKQNRVANNVFNSPKGSSDYEGLTSIFDSIDETVSAMVDVIKKSRIYTFIPERMLTKDDTGRIRPNQAYGIDVWDIAKVAEENERLPQRDYVPINVQPYTDALMQFIKTALNRVGLSPSTLGLDDAGANASAEALNIRDARTERTYNDKSNLWKPALEQLARLLLIFAKAKNGEKSGDGYLVPKSLATMPFICTFPSFKELSASQKFQAWLPMIEQGAMSVEWAMEQALGEDIAEAEIETIKKQLGMMPTEAEEAEEDKPPIGFNEN